MFYPCQAAQSCDAIGSLIANLAGSAYVGSAAGSPTAAGARSPIPSVVPPGLRVRSKADDELKLAVASFQASALASTAPVIGVCLVVFVVAS